MLQIDPILDQQTAAGGNATDIIKEFESKRIALPGYLKFKSAERYYAVENIKEEFESTFRIVSLTCLTP